MWDLIVSVPDHCLSFYFSYSDRDNIALENLGFFLYHSITKYWSAVILDCRQKVTLLTPRPPPPSPTRNFAYIMYLKEQLCRHSQFKQQTFLRRMRDVCIL